MLRCFRTELGVRLRRGPAPLAPDGWEGCAPNVRCDPRGEAWNFSGWLRALGGGQPRHKEHGENEPENPEEQSLKHQRRF